MDTFEVDLGGRRRRRRHSAQFKQAVVRECLRPLISIAAVALHHKLNANMLRKWVSDSEHLLPLASTPSSIGANLQAESAASTFVPVTLSTPSGERDIRVQWQRSGATVIVVWPASVARDCAVWLRELMR